MHIRPSGWGPLHYILPDKFHSHDGFLSVYFQDFKISAAQIFEDKEMNKNISLDGALNILTVFFRDKFEVLGTSIPWFEFIVFSQNIMTLLLSKRQIFSKSAILTCTFSYMRTGSGCFFTLLLPETWSCLPWTRVQRKRTRKQLVMTMTSKMTSKIWSTWWRWSQETECLLPIQFLIQRVQWEMETSKINEEEKTEDSQKVQQNYLLSGPEPSCHWICCISRKRWIVSVLFPKVCQNSMARCRVACHSGELCP